MDTRQTSKTNKQDNKSPRRHPVLINQTHNTKSARVLTSEVLHDTTQGTQKANKTKTKAGKVCILNGKHLANKSFEKQTN